MSSFADQERIKGLYIWVLGTFDLGWAIGPLFSLR